MSEPLFLPLHEWELSAGLPSSWRAGFDDWTYARRLLLRNPIQRARPGEPVEVDVEIHEEQLSDPARELRVLSVPTAEGPALEVPCQVRVDAREDGRWRCRLWFVADIEPGATHTFLVLSGFAQAPAPAYTTDLQVSGQDYALDVANAYYRIGLAPSNGHLKSVAFQQGRAAFHGYGPPMDPGVIGDGKHGVEGSVHWNPDWSDGQVGRYRVTNWTRPPAFDVVRGPVFTRVERSGHPILGLGPCGNSDKVLAHVAYTFWTGVPWFMMESRLDVLQDVRFRDCRNDEWVGMGASMPRQAWQMAGADTVGFGRQGWRGEDPAWMSFFNEETGDAFATLRLEYECTHPHFPAPASVAILDRSWVRYPVRNVLMRAGDTIRERSALLLHRYDPSQGDGFTMLHDWQARLQAPLEQQDAPVATRALTEAAVADALRACRELEIYVQGNYNSIRTPGFYDLGLVRAIHIEGADVRLDMIVPYDGRQSWFGWFADTARAEIHRRIPEVATVDVRLVDEPTWSPDLMTAGARRLTGL